MLDAWLVLSGVRLSQCVWWPYWVEWDMGINRGLKSPLSEARVLGACADVTTYSSASVSSPVEWR